MFVDLDNVHYSLNVDQENSSVSGNSNVMQKQIKLQKNGI